VSGSRGAFQPYDKAQAACYLAERFARLPWSVADEREKAAVARLAAKFSPRLALDLACGTARMASAVRNAPVVAADASEAMLRESAGATGGDKLLVRADAFALPFKSGAFDMVICFRFLRHLDAAKRSAALAEIRRVLATGGRLVFDALNAKMGAFDARCASCNERRIHDERYTPRSLRRELEECGFEAGSLIPVMRHLRAYHLANAAGRGRLAALRRKFIAVGERVPSRFPFSWVATARRM